MLDTRSTNLREASPNAGVEGQAPGESSAPAPRGPDAQVDLRPRLAPEVNLLGEMRGSGFADGMWLVQIGGRFIQLTELLYRTAEHCDGEHSLEEIASAVSNSSQWQMNADDARFLVMERLAPIGMVVVSDDVSDLPTLPQSAPSLLRLGLRRGVISADTIEPVARRLQHLFNPLVLIPIALAGLLGHAWMYLDRGIGGLLTSTLYTPGLLLVIFVMAILPGFWHEFGHASALRYGGGRARSIGVGIYIMDPAFYTDVTDSYRLGRWGRVRTGLGGIYFDLILSSVFIAAYALTGAQVLLALVVLSNINTLYQFFPLVRLDGYWILADLTGVPDFYSMMGSFVRSVVPLKRWKGQRLPDLKPWVRAVFGLYTVVAIPGMLVFMVILLRRVPGILNMVWDAFRQNATDIPAAWQDADWLTVAALCSQVLLLSVSLIGLAWFLVLLARTLLLLSGRLTQRLARRVRPAVHPSGA